MTAALTFARQALEAEGYTVVRSLAGVRPIDLVAWRERELRFILVRQVRQHPPAAGVAARFAPEIAVLRGFPPPPTVSPVQRSSGSAIDSRASGDTGSSRAGSWNSIKHGQAPASRDTNRRFLGGAVRSIG